MVTGSETKQRIWRTGICWFWLGFWDISRDHESERVVQGLEVEEVNYVG